MWSQLQYFLLTPQRREREIQQQLMAKEESAMEMRETFASLQEEVEHKTKKLNKVQLCGQPDVQ